MLAAQHTLQQLLPLLSYLQLPSVWAPLQLLGATSGSVLALVFPGALRLAAAGWQPATWAGSQGLLLVLVGFLLSAAGVAESLLSLLGAD